MRKDAVEYELGVMMYSAYNVKVNNAYDVQDNFEHLVKALGKSVDINEFKEGYIAEGENHNVAREDLKEQFEKDLKYLKEIL